MRAMDRVRYILVLVLLVVIALAVVCRQELGSGWRNSLRERLHHSCRNC